ncbi:MAG: universal stress protein family protein [Rhodobacteraceae bacterium HLUCCA09]|nr:MAG: universal stress protein family protein [Rhodobacteraceae bacterium HLUCCA09]
MNAAAGPAPVLAALSAERAEGPGPDDATLALAAGLAADEGAPLAAVMAAALPRDIDALAHAASLTPEAMRSRMTAVLARRLDALCSATAPDAAREVRLGKPFVEIIRAVQARGAGLLVKAAEDLPSASAALLASTDQHLIRKCPCPVWLVRGGAARPRRVVAAIDVTEPDERALNLAIVAAAARVAHPDGAEIRLLHAWQAEGEGMVRMWSDDSAAFDRYLAEVEHDHASAMRAFAEEARAHLAALGATARLTPVLRRGAPRRAIPRDVAEHKAEALVLGTLSRSGIPGLLIGNTAEDVLNAVSCSVVAVKPEGYESPIR